MRRKNAGKWKRRALRTRAACAGLWANRWTIVGMGLLVRLLM